jgi:hypothetical protein
MAIGLGLCLPLHIDSRKINLELGKALSLQRSKGILWICGARSFVEISLGGSEIADVHRLAVALSCFKRKRGVRRSTSDWNTGNIPML